jgi:DNA-binding MarR family transcriptional regulator
MNSESRRDLEVLEALSAEGRITQRSLASKLGIAVGLSNLYLRRLAKKGYIKFVNVQPNRVVYLLTPRGISEKTRLTYEFMEHSLRVYSQVRAHLTAVLRPHVNERALRVAVFGTGEAAELAYLSLKEVGLEPVAFFGTGEKRTFLGSAVRDIDDCAAVPFDLLVLASLNHSDELIAQLVARGVPEHKLITLRSGRAAGADGPQPAGNFK